MPYCPPARRSFPPLLSDLRRPGPRFRAARSLPQARPALPVAPTHGLGAVAALAARWGADPSAEGKEVWAELSR